MEDLKARQSEIVKELVDLYISTGDPVSSEELTKRVTEDLSSATLRAEMKDLEGKGWLLQPHTSAGRIPTDEAYRYFVEFIEDHLQADYYDDLKRKMKRALKRRREMTELADWIAKETSTVSLLATRDRILVRGHINLLDMPEFSEIGEEMMKLLDNPKEYLERVAPASESQVEALIGKELTDTKLNRLSLVIGRAKDSNMVGVVGPKRLNYKKAIPTVKVAIKSFDERRK